MKSTLPGVYLFCFSCGTVCQVVLKCKQNLNIEWNDICNKNNPANSKSTVCRFFYTHEHTHTKTTSFNPFFLAKNYKLLQYTGGC